MKADDIHIILAINIISRHQQKLRFTNSNDFVKYRTHKFNTHQLVQDAPSLQRFILQASTNQPELPKTKRPMQAFPAQINESDVENSPKNSGPSKLHSRYPQFALTSCTVINNYRMLLVWAPDFTRSSYRGSVSKIPNSGHCHFLYESDFTTIVLHHSYKKSGP